MNESNYEEAILAFTQAIEIDSKNVEGYLGRAEAYLGAGGEENRALAVADYLTAADLCVEQGNPERAEEILNNAQEAVGEDPEISDKLYEITGKRPDTKLENKYFKDGSLKVEYEYDERELLVKETYYNTDGSLSYYLNYEYNENNNVIERLNREIRRRTRVVGSFPDGNSALMLVCARLRHVAGTQWGNKKYMNMKHLEAAVEDASIAG